MNYSEVLRQGVAKIPPIRLFSHFSFLLYIEDLKGELNFHVLFSVENVTEVYNVQQLKQLTSEAENSLQSSPTMGIVYAFVTSFDIDRDEKPIVTSRWWVGLKSSVHYGKLTVFTGVGYSSSTPRSNKLNAQ